MRVTQEEIQRAEQVDLLSYLQASEPGNLRKISGNEYCTTEHDSLRISNGKWHWYSRGIGGYNAVQYLMKVREMSFPEAVRQVLQIPDTPYRSPPRKIEARRELQLPKRCSNANRVISYLEGREISKNVILYCLDRQILYESEPYHSAVFVGTDKTGTLRYGNIRATKGDFKGECTGSDKRYAFRLMPEHPKSNAIHIFEAAIDALSFATYAEIRGAPWKEMNLLALGGVAGIGNKIPLALSQCLKDYPFIRAIYLHLDNDMPGREAAANMVHLLEKDYEIHDNPPKVGKDVNEFLQKIRDMQQKQRISPCL